MKILYTTKDPRDLINGYALELSSNDTHDWANAPTASWPCSTVEDHKLTVHVDSNGLCDLWLDNDNGPDLDGTEVAAIVADHLPAHLSHLWPTWKH